MMSVAYCEAFKTLSNCFPQEMYTHTKLMPNAKKFKVSSALNRKHEGYPQDGVKRKKEFEQ